jgi:hypothetical protein
MKSFVLSGIQYVVHLHVIFNWVRISRKARSIVFGSLARNNFIILAIRQRRTMSISFFLLEA